uniref:hypothetical protein n=1 Tax=Paenibacillus albidus TaxID=2041023 RepID=UPI001E58FB59|nr:hypothetical protein [Paenibacillus albidus]
MYIQYTMDQLCLPMNLEEDIPENHLVRVVNAAVNRLDDTIFDAAYPGGGRDSYHPKMSPNSLSTRTPSEIYSSRKSPKRYGRIFPSCGWPDGSARIFASSTVFALSG